MTIQPNIQPPLGENPRMAFVRQLPGAHICTGESDDGRPESIGIINVAWRTCEERDACVKLMQHSGLWSSLMLYYDVAGWAVHAVRNPGMGPIRNWTLVTA